MASFQTERTFVIPQLDVLSHLPGMPFMSTYGFQEPERRTLEEIDDFSMPKKTMTTWDSDTSEPDSTRTTPEIKSMVPPPLSLSPLHGMSMSSESFRDSDCDASNSKPRKNKKTTPRRKPANKKAGKSSAQNRSNSRQQFWELVWPKLEGEGWCLEPGKRKRDNDFYFYPPNTDRSTARYRVDYFDSVRLVLSELEKRGQHDSLLQEYYKHEPAPKLPARESKREVTALMPTESTPVYRGRGKRSSRKVVKYDPSALPYATSSPPKKQCVESQPTTFSDEQDAPWDVIPMPAPGALELPYEFWDPSCTPTWAFF